MKTFTTCAEKKAKQFLNLLQGYTKGIRITAILILLLMGVGNAWGAGQYNLNWQGKVYFLVPEKWDINTYPYIQVDITRTTSASSSNYQYYAGKMTQVGNSRLYYLTLNADHSGWNQNEYLAFTANDHEYGSGTFNLNGNVFRTKPIDYGCNNANNFYLFKPNSESNFRTTTNDNTMSGDWSNSRDNLLKKKQTIDLYLGDTQSDTGGSIEMQGYYFTSNTAITSSSLTSSSSSVSYDAVIGTEMTLIATPKAGYSFVGWYDGETQLSTNATYSYCIYDTKTIKAKFKENTYTVTISAGDGGTVSPSGSQTVGQVTAKTVTATPNANYEFVNWTATGGVVVANTTSASTTITATATGTLTANFRSTATNSLTVVAGANIESVTGSTDPVTLGNTYPITATPETGYSFNTWTASPAANATFASATSARTNVTVKNGSVTVTASATEIMSTLTTSNHYDNGNPGYDAPEASVSSIGIATTATVTATAAGEGYTFEGWTLTNCTRTDGGATNATTITVRSNGDGEAATVTANYKEKTKVRLYYSNNNWSKINAYLWDNSNDSDKNKNWPGEEITSNVVEMNCNTYYYYEYYKEDHPNWNRVIFNDGSNQTSDITFSNTDNNGQYYINDEWVASPDAKWVLKGSMSNDNWATAYPLTCTNATSGSVDLTLAANTKYEFKFVDNENNTWYGVTTATQITYTNKGTAQTMNNTGGGSANQTILTAGAGTYTFTWDITNKKVTVTYPTSYTVTYSRTPTAAADAPTTAPSITSGNYVAAGTSVTFTAKDANNGYTWKGWYDNEAGIGTALSSNQEYNTSISANTTIYAVYTTNTYDINYITPTHGTFTIQVGSNTPVSANTTADYKTTITLANTPATGYHFGSWDITPNDVSITNSNTFSMPASDVAIGVTFAANTYKVKFNKNADDATGSMSDQSFTYDEASKALTANAFTRTGYTFAGWNTKDDGTGTSYTNGQEVQNLTANNNGTITLYAQWTINNYNITYTAPTHGTFTIKVGSNAPVSANTTADYNTTITLSNTPATGYHFGSWNITPSVSITNSKTFLMPANHVTIGATFIPNSYTVIFNKNANDATGSMSDQSFTYDEASKALTANAFTRTGYTFDGWNTKDDGTGVSYTDGQEVQNLTAENEGTVTLYAQWTANTYTVTLQHSTIAGYGSVGTSSVTATYDADMPSATMPTAANGYVFMGYFDGEQGAGTQYYNADGTSAHVWDKAEDATLYAHFVKVEITQITLDKYTFEPVEAGGTGFVTATPTIEPTPTNAVVLCWRLLYNNGNEVPGRSAQEVSGNIVKFSIAGLAAGTYKIEAVLRTGSNCGSGDVLSTKTVNFTIASNYTITVKYTCDGKEIMAASKVPARVSEETEITAPNITGYTFSSWEAGDGVTIKSTNGNSVKITAIYDGYLTAKYTARPMVYFKNTLGWEKVYVYTFSDNAWWNDGTGVHPATNKLEQGEMTQIGESDVYYFELDKPDSDYTQDNNANPNYIAFSNKDMRTENGAFWECDAIYRGDHKAELTLFVPQKDQTPETHNKTKYYSKGIWMKYNSTESGYQLPGTIPNDDPDHDGWGTYGNKFTAQTPGGYTFSITKYLEANTEYTFKIKNYVWVKDYNNTDNNQWFGYDGTINNSTTNWLHFKGDNDEGKNNGDAKIKTTAEGEYTFTIDLSQGKVLLSVEYPIEVGDYRVIYKDNAIWSQGTAHDANWYHPSRIIKKNKTAEPTKDIISFFISYGQSTTMQFQRVTNITNGKVTWADAGEARIPDAVNKAGVYNFIVTQTANGASISMENSAEPYTGNYYIRVDALAGKWDNYKTNPENRMTYSAFSESEANSFGDKYSHYATKYCDEGTNIKFVIANDYSPCISDTLAQDVKVNGANPFDNLDEHGTIKSDYQQNKANVRFMWNHKTNKISRVYIGSAAETGRHFLVLKSDKEMKDEDGNNLQNEGDDHAQHKAVFKDTQNWMYERTIKVQPGTRVKLYACYPMDNSSLDAAEQKAQHFRGAYDSNTWNEENSVVILGGSGTDWNTIRVIYDFKTNRLMAALVPDQEVSGEKTIAADVMIIRKHQDAATSITLTNDNSKLKEVKTVYGSLQLNRWVLNNRNSEKSGIEYCTKKVDNQDTYDENVTNEHHPVLSPGEQKSIYERALYFISFPFDVHLSDVFGFGTYGTHWVISDYNGLRRAQRGYFAEDCINEDCTNWDYIWDPSNFTLKANQGYLLSLDLDLMRYDNTDFWLHNIDQVELFFPSTANLETIEKTSYTMPALGEEYLCKINHNTDGTTPDRDRRVKDSYWRCIGVPSFADYDGSLYKSKEDAEADQYPINWNTDYTWTADESGFPFLYEWNVTDNSLSVQNTSAYQFKPTFAYLVQNGGAIHWKAVNSKPSSVIARQRTETARNYEWKIALMRDGNQEDQTFVRITDNENVTTEFDFNQDLAKEFNYGRSDIYTLIGYERAAANSMPCSDETTIIPLGLNIEQAGDYTISMPEGVENIGITLVDNETGIHTNLSAGQEYTLTLNKGICENRLFIEVSPIQHSTTDLEYTTEDTREQTTRKILIDGMLYLIRDGVIYDAQGHKL